MTLDINLFDAGLLGSNGVFAEAYYAQANNRVDVDFASVNGFSVGLTYTPSMEFNTGSGIARAQAETTASFAETIHAAVGYSGEMDGNVLLIGVGTINELAKSICRFSCN